MKLLAKYNRVTIPITIATLLISSIAFYFIIHHVLVHQLDKDLLIEKQEILHHIDETGALPEVSDYKDQQINFTISRDRPMKNKFSTQTVYDSSEGEEKTFSRLDFPVSANGITYIATVKKSQQETEDIVRLILMITFAVIAFLLLILSIASRFLLGKLWQPFNNTIEQLKQFNLQGKNEIELLKTNVDEFTDLNNAAFLMTQKVNTDYELLKSFTENASHEIQTPLAIIKTKLELLSQSENLAEAQVNAIQSLNDATTRLSKLNQSLLLLTKIENRQFATTEKVNIASVLLGYLDNFEELAETKNINIQKNIPTELLVEMNESLAEILISNMIINAIKHNHKGGTIDVDIEDHTLFISNTGHTPTNGTADYFERFKKDTASNDSLGLGLSIVKKICETYGFLVSYKYERERHVVSVQFTAGS
ncbi:MAG: HAMP domain-containing sensor histidine kinase [Bacteroidota bacterium]|nr:HAMP domain-containing sensor histidine kinase [Bacteroidota bacterium]